MPKRCTRKSFVQLRLTKTDAYAALAALKTTLELDDQQPVTSGLKGFTARLFRKSLVNVKDMLEAELKPKTPKSVLTG